MITMAMGVHVQHIYAVETTTMQQLGNYRVKAVKYCSKIFGSVMCGLTCHDTSWDDVLENKIEPK